VQGHSEATDGADSTDGHSHIVFIAFCVFFLFSLKKEISKSPSAVSVGVSPRRLLVILRNMSLNDFVLDLETPRLHFRRFTLDDLQALAGLRSDPDVMKHVGSRRPESIEEVQVVLNRVIAHWEQHGFAPFALIDTASGKLAGWCGLKYLEDTGEVEIAYGFAKAYWGNGLASEAAAAVMQYGFDQLRLDRIVAVVWPENIASVRVLEKLGMRREAALYKGEMLYYILSRDAYQIATASTM
jgi:ribosomal-protein-alanine N-acetyltransferase